MPHISNEIFLCIFIVLKKFDTSKGETHPFLFSISCSFTSSLFSHYISFGSYTPHEMRAACVSIPNSLVWIDPLGRYGKQNSMNGKSDCNCGQNFIERPRKTSVKWRRFHRFSFAHVSWSAGISQFWWSLCIPHTIIETIYIFLRKMTFDTRFITKKIVSEEA